MRAVTTSPPPTVSSWHRLPRRGTTSCTCCRALLKEIRVLSDDETLHVPARLRKPKIPPGRTPSARLASRCTSTAFCSLTLPLTGGFAPKLGELLRPGPVHRRVSEHIDPRHLGCFEPTGLSPTAGSPASSFLDKTDAEKQLRGYWQRWLSARQSFMALIREAITGTGIGHPEHGRFKPGVRCRRRTPGIESGDLVAYGYFTQVHRPARITDPEAAQGQAEHSGASNPRSWLHHHG